MCRFLSAFPQPVSVNMKLTGATYKNFYVLGELWAGKGLVLILGQVFLYAGFLACEFC